MKRVVKKIVKYACGTCRQEYASSKEAERCERGEVEHVSLHLNRGRRVRVVMPRVCQQAKIRFFTGQIISSRLEAYDPETHFKGYGVERSGHVRLYRIRYECPVCEKIKTADYPAEALRAAS
jgi:hypothetical protein